jgi:hypothetical protein
MSRQKLLKRGQRVKGYDAQRHELDPAKPIGDKGYDSDGATTWRSEPSNP